MRLGLDDFALLRGIDPGDVISYLRSRAWAEQDSGDRASIWTKPASDSESFEVLVPRSRDLRDFPYFVAELITTISQSEQRPESQIVTDLLNVRADVIRAGHPSSDDNTLPIIDGAGLIQGARNMMLAAACAAIRPRSVYWASKPVLAVHYVNNVRLGQTEPGSYVITIISKVPTALSQMEAGVLLPDIDDPFERKVTRQLHQAVTATKESSGLALRTGSFDAFRAGIESGISANLCESLVEMSERDRVVQLNFVWAANRPAPVAEAGAVVFRPDEMAILAEVARQFRESAPIPDYEVIGVIVKLERPSDSSIGVVTVMADVDGRPHPVRIRLSTELYDVAGRAHFARRPIRAVGMLAREGRTFWLEDAQVVAEWSDPANPDLF